VFGGQGVGGLGGQGGVVGQGLATEGGDDAVVDSPDADGGVGQVDDGVAAAIQARQCGAHGDGLAGANLAGDDADAAIGNAPADAGDGLVVGGVPVQHGRGQIAPEWRARKTKVGDQVGHHFGWASWPVSRSSWPGI
jgi:hypothetical protein